MDMNISLLLLAVLISCSAEGKSLKVCRKSLRRLHKRSSFLEGSVIFPPHEDRDSGCVEYELNTTTTPRPPVTLPSRWVYHPQPVLLYLPRGSSQLGTHMWLRPVPGGLNLSQIINSTQPGSRQPVVVHAQPLRPVNTPLTPDLQALLRGQGGRGPGGVQPVVVHTQPLRPVYTPLTPDLQALLRGQGGRGPGGVQPVLVRPVNTIQVPVRGMNNWWDTIRRRPDFQNEGGFIKGPHSGPPFRPPLPLAHVYPPKHPYHGVSKSKS